MAQHGILPGAGEDGDIVIAEAANWPFGAAFNIFQPSTRRIDIRPTTTSAIRNYAG